jgi:hypothetical protein
VTNDEPGEQPAAPDEPAGAAGSDRAREGVEHLQAAARELIAAARAALDVAEDLVDDPDMATSMAGAVGSLGDLVRNVTAGWLGAGNAADSANARAAGNGHDPEDQAEPPDDGVQRITVR